MKTYQPDQNADWRSNAEATDADPDDELLPQTPLDVVLVLGFDPLDESSTVTAAADEMVKICQDWHKNEAAHA